MKVTQFKDIKHTKGGIDRSIENVIFDIKNGTWQDLVFEIHTAPDDKTREQLKRTVPYFTTSGTFKSRSNEGLIQHSGLIAADFDDVPNINAAFDKLEKDPYTYAIFKSISGTGICVIVKINPNRHAESFEGLQEYYYNNYRLNIDLACRDIPRARFISYDPSAYLNTASKLFELYPKKETKEQTAERNTKYLHTQSKFERVLGKVDRDITGNYRQWLALGFAIASEYGSNGVDYFIHLSSFSASFDRQDSYKQYMNCVKYIRTQPGSYSISTFYYYAKLHNIDIRDEREEEISKKAYFATKAGKDPKELIKDLTEDDKQVIEAVASNKSFKPTKDKEVNINDVILWLHSAYPIRRNEITRMYELDGAELEMENLNTIYLEGKKIFEKLSRELFETIIFSTHTESYNPIKIYFDSLQWDGTDRLTDLSASITSCTGTPQWRKTMLTKWLLGIIASVYDGDANILCLVLAGAKNTGKTQFFRRLLPTELNRFFANSQLDKGKDDEILMTQKLIIFDDEYSGKSKQDAKLMKYMLSSDSFTLREPYGRKNVHLKRLASLCGTCNETEILNDPTGNRRIIVFEAIGQFNYALYNAIDKAQLFAQVKALYQAGESHHLTSEEIAEMELYTLNKYSEISLERELILKYFAKTTSQNDHLFKSTSEVKVYIEERTRQKLSLKKLGMELRALDYLRGIKGKVYGYFLDEIPDFPNLGKTQEMQRKNTHFDVGSDAPF